MTNQKELKQLYWIYHNAKGRCTNQNHKRFKDYGGRGIQFNFKSFEDWLNYMGPRPPGFEMDRINNDGHYEIGNLQWVDFSTQQKNKRIYKTNTSGIRGVTYVVTLKKWVTRVNNKQDGKRDYLYVGEDFFEACCARLSWESGNSEIKIRNRRGKDFERDRSRLGV